jgi:GH18 family chitinase
VGQHTAFPTAVQKVDRINLMTFGLSSATYHADYTKMREAVETLMKEAGVPAHKIFIGLPAYGTHKRTGETKAYHDLAREYLGTDNNNNNDDPVVSLHKRIELGGGFLVDSPAAIQAKVRFAIQKGLGGVFFWELGQDQDRVLLAAAARQAGKIIPPPQGGDKAVPATTTLAASTAEEEEERESAETTTAETAHDEL